MKKKLVYLLALMLVLALFGSVLGACNLGTQDIFNGDDDANDASNQDETNQRFGADELYSDNGYIDYAKEVYYDMDANPDLVNQGMFWCYWDENSETMVQVPAATERGAALVDPTKPTLICIHGVLSDGATNQEVYDFRTFYVTRDRDIYGYSNTQQNINMIEMWIRKGWNVGMFNYNRFATELNPGVIEEKVWCGRGEVGMVYANSKAEMIDSGSEYCIAEHFAAEYIRAMKLLPETLGNQEIRFISHSMGGEVLSSGTFLLTELVKDGQLSAAFLPDRVALLDSYFSVKMQVSGSSNVVSLSPVGIKINWSGKGLVGGTTGESGIACLEVLHHEGIVIEYYSYDGSFLNKCMDVGVKARLQKIASYVMMNPDYADNYPGFVYAVAGHNGVREWYMASLYAQGGAKDTNGNSVPYAGMPTDELRGLIGSSYQIVSGAKTLTIDDDVFEKIN